MEHKARLALAGLAAASLSLVGLSPAAQAAPGSGGGGDVVKEGSCSGASTWKLKVGLDNGQIDGEFEVDQNVVGQTWKVEVTDNGTRVFKGTQVTQAPSGSFELNFRTADQAGTDMVRARAMNPATGETCKASINF